MKRTPLRARRSRRRPDEDERDAAAERAAAWAATKQEAWLGWGQRCAVGRQLIDLHAVHGHHRLMRSAGGPDTVANCLPVCHRCHRRIHENADAKSYDNGWLVRAWLLPEDVAILGDPRR